MGCGGIPRAAMPLGDGSRRSRGGCTSRHAAMSESEYAGRAETQPASGLYGEARGTPHARGLDPKGVEEAGGFHKLPGGRTHSLASCNL